MQDQKKLQIALLEATGRRIQHLGFKQNLSHHSFYRQTDFGKHALHLTFVPHKDDIDVIADVGIRFDVLEELVYSLMNTRFLSERDKRYTFSFGSELGRIVGKGQMRWTIVSSSDIESASKKIVDFFQEIGLPYFEKYVNMCEVFEVISTVSREAELLNALPDKLARNAIALAYLCNKDPDTFQKLVQQMTAYLSPIPNSGVEDFRDFVDRISRKSSDLDQKSGSVLPS